MKIEWTRCADKMPPWDGKAYILCNGNSCIRLSGVHVNMLARIPGDKWTPYTPEIWKELNK